MLTHKSIQANISAAAGLLAEGKADDKTRFLSLLPLSHAYEHTAGLHLPLSMGANVWFCNSPERFAQDLQEVQPINQEIILKFRYDYKFLRELPNDIQEIHKIIYYNYIYQELIINI